MGEVPLDLCNGSRSRSDVRHLKGCLPVQSIAPRRVAKAVESSACCVVSATKCPNIDVRAKKDMKIEHPWLLPFCFGWSLRFRPNENPWFLRIVVWADS